MPERFPPRPDLWSLDPSVLHLNHGSYGAVPVHTQQVAAGLRARMEANPMGWFRALPERLATVRASLAGYLGTDPAGFALVPNATTGVTVALATLPIPAGSRIVVTDHVYGAVRYAAERFARRNDAEVVTVAVPMDATDDQVVAAVAAAIDERTAVVLLDQITSATAMVFPTARLVALCRDAGVPVVVDGAHAPGLVDEPAADGADFWTGNFHKWPCAPRGTAGLVVAERWRAATLPPIASWSEYDDLPARFDQQGTDDRVAWLAAPTSLEVLAELDWPAYRGHLIGLLADGCALIAKAIGTRVVEPAAPAPTMALVELPPSMAADEAALEAVKARSAAELGAEITLTGFDGRAYLRLSAHAYNGLDDYESFAARLPRLIA